MNTIKIGNTIEIQNKIDEYCQAVHFGEAGMLRKICLPSTQFIGYTLEGCLVRQSLDEFSKDAANDDFAWRNDLYRNATIMSVDYLDDDVVIVKLMMGDSILCCSEILSLRLINGSWRIAGRIFSEVSHVDVRGIAWKTAC